MQYPIFYRNKINKGSVMKPNYFYRNAIDIGLRSYQFRAVGVIIDYICKYQNNYTSSFLFSKNLPEIIAKGIPCAKLLESQVFYYRFDYDEWPSIHTNDFDINRPFNGSIFSLR